MQEWQKMCSHSGVSVGSSGMPKQIGHSNAHGPSCKERLVGAEVAATDFVVLLVVGVDVMTG